MRQYWDIEAGESPSIPNFIFFKISFILQSVLGFGGWQVRHFCLLKQDGCVLCVSANFFPARRNREFTMMLHCTIKPWFFQYLLTFLVWIDLEGLVRANKAVWKNFHWEIFCRRRDEKRAYPEIFRFYYNCRMAGDRFIAADRGEPQ